MSLKIAIVGASGVVGLEARKLAREILGKPVELALFASSTRPEDGVLSLEENVSKLQDCKYVLNAASSDQAQFVRERMLPSQILVDNSSAFRMEPGVPLVVPEVNGDELKRVKEFKGPKVVANPNCTAAILCVALSAIKKFGIRRVQVSTYQAASGAGIKGLEELVGQIRNWVKNETAAIEGGPVFRHPLFLNVMSHNSAIQAPGAAGEFHNEEEWKVIQETQKILDDNALQVSVTSMRVPVLRAHTEAVSVLLKEPVSREALHTAFQSAAGLRVVDDWKNNHFPMPVESQNQDLVFVGRIRKDLFDEAWSHFLISGDQLRKGAASNALQIIRDLEKLGG